VFVLLGGSGFLPLFGGPGYEAALAAGVVLPATVAAITSLEVSACSPAPFDAFGRGVANGVVLGLLALVLSVLHGARVGFCDPTDGIAQLALAPGFGAVVAGAWGAAAGLVTASIPRRRRRITLALLLAFAGPLASIAVSFWRFVSSPMVFAFDPFFGYFAGPLYDTVIEPLDRLESYRLGSLFTLLAAGVAMYHLERRGRELVLVSRRRPGVALAGVACAAASAGIALAGAKLGHWSTTETIRAELERSLSSQRCEIVYAPSIPLREAEILGRECDAHVRALEAWFGVEEPERITVFVFESEAQKGRLMGASSTYIAKPWRREIYIQFARYPHPVMGHELAHVVAGRFGEGPFRVSGPLGGWFPDPGRIEGVATAATPSDDPEFTLQEWSRAMLDLGLLPPLDAVFRLSFLGENSSTAYTVAGAFIEWLHDTYGPEAVRGWYSGSPLERVTGGKSLSTLEVEWRDALGRLKLPPQALISARARFDRPAIFGRKCPHVVDRLTGEAHGRLAQGDFRGAKERFEKVLRLDPESFAARMGLGSCALRAGDEAEARRRWGELTKDPELHRLLQLAAEEAIADLDLSAGHLDAAQRRYAVIAENVSDEDRLRTLDVKSHPGSDLGRQAVAALLVGDPKYGRDFGEAAALLGRWSAAEPENGLPDYLLGRNFYLGGRYPSAQRELDRALSRKIELPRVEVEAVRMQLIVACAQNDLARAKAALASWNAISSKVDPGERDAVARMASRCGATE